MRRGRFGNNAMFQNFYAGKRVLVTGHTGFKGAWLALWLRRLGALVSGLGLKPPSTPNLHEAIEGFAFADQTACDIRNLAQLESAVSNSRPDIIFHLAAQPLVRLSYQQPLETFETNALGTANLLEAVRRLDLPTAIVVVTTDKCYENRGWEYGYRENDPLGGHDVYSMSKAAAELVVQSWRRSFFEPNPRLGNIASARGGNVIGGGDYAQDRIIPDCIRALLAGQPIQVRHPSATRPWQHVFDCLSGYLWLGALLAKAAKGSALASAFNFGPGPQANLPVSFLVQTVLNIWPGEWRHIASANAPHEAEKLTLAIDKAASALQWFPTWSFEESIRETITWYHERHVKKNMNMVEFSLSQIEAFTRDARKKHLAWAEPLSD